MSESTTAPADGVGGVLDSDLYRAGQNDQDIRWHHVGPDHERCAFNLIDLIGYAPLKWGADAPPYKLYNVWRWQGAKIVENSYATIPAAKRAGRAWVKEWLQGAGNGPIIWEPTDTGFHFWAHAEGVEIATMYYCPEARGGWHKDFRVWFGCTYYRIAFRDPDEAKAKVAVTWAQWLRLAKAHLLGGGGAELSRCDCNEAAVSGVSSLEREARRNR